MADLLTADELAVVDLTIRLAESLARVVGDGPTRNADLNELLVHVHAIQHAVLAQAAARAYPERFRLMGGTVEAKPTYDVTFVSNWRPMAPWQVAEMTGRPEQEIRDLYGDTVNVRMDLRGPQELRRGGPKPSAAELRATRATIAKALGGETSRPSCCRCDPSVCEADESGDHCITRGCAYCLNGCPATDRPCCKEPANG